MSYICFENKGEIDIRSIKTFGVSVKETENPIGYFGTGLKYAIAILLRNKQQVEAQVGLNKYIFELKTTEIRGKEFSIITMNGEEMPFTTELGKNWELWQAFREIYCNAIDEGGGVESTFFRPSMEADKTTFIVKGDDFEKEYKRRHEIVLNLAKHLLLNVPDEVEIYNKESAYIYYRRIRVAPLEKPSLFTYNILESLDLTEDRTLKHEYSALSIIPRAISTMTDKKAIQKALTSSSDYLESTLNFEMLSYYEGYLSDEFREVLREEFNANNDNLNKSARAYHKKYVNTQAAKNYEEVEPTTVEAIRLEKCKRVLSKVYPDFINYKIVIVKTLGEITMAQANREMRAMILSKACFERGTKYLLSTMIEEYAHLRTGYNDHTRELQTWLFDNICTLIEDHVIKEPI